MNKNILSVLLLVIGAAGLSQPTLSIQTSTPNCYSAVGTNAFIVTVSNTPSGSSYVWSSQGPSCTNQSTVSGNTAIFNYSCCGVHTVSCQVFTNSTLCCVATASVMINCPPNMTFTNSTANGTLCAGQSVMCVLTGAQSYTFFPPLPPFPPLVVTPMSNACYSVLGMSSFGCVGLASTCVTVIPTPSITLSSSVSTGPGSTLCAGSSATIGITGSVTTFSWNTGATTPTIVVSPSANTCYSVVAASSAGCSNLAQICVSVLPVPTLFLAGSPTVCLGSSVLLSAAGAMSYLWPHNNATTTTVSVLPTAPSVYSVIGTGGNSCTATSTIQVSPDANCAIVWPGDANSDGIVTGADVIEIGLFASATGPLRSPGGNNYSGQYATAWSGNGSNSQNRCHVDCNGDGTVNGSDTLAVNLNWAQTHSFRLSESQAAGNIGLSGPAWIATSASGWHKVDILIGDAANQVQDLYGVVFDLEYDQSFVDNNQVHVAYPASFIGTPSQRIPFRRIDPAGGLVNCVTVRNTGTSVNGFGKIGEFHFMNKALVTGAMEVRVTNVRLYDHNGLSTPLAAASTTIYAGTSDLPQVPGDSPLIYPNPAHERLTLISALPGHYKICDLSGRLLISASSSGTAEIAISALADGIYLLEWKTEQSSSVHRVIKR